MKKFIPFLLIGVLAFSACGKEKTIEAKNESIESVADKSKSLSIKPKAGRWESEFKIEKMEIEGMPASMQKNMEMQGATKFAYCLSKENAEKPDAEFFNPKSGGCKYESFNMGNGKIDAKMICKSDGGTMTMNMEGSYSEKEYTIHTDANMSMENHGMKMSQTTTSKWVGECKGDESKENNSF